MKSIVFCIGIGSIRLFWRPASPALLLGIFLGWGCEGGVVKTPDGNDLAADAQDAAGSEDAQGDVVLWDNAPGDDAPGESGQRDNSQGDVGQGEDIQGDDTLGDEIQDGAPDSSTALQIGPITVSTPGPIPKYKKFEISFSIANTVAQNLHFSYDPSPSPYPGHENYPYDQGITVDALFLPPGETNWDNAFRQPAFVYQDFIHETHPSPYGVDWYYPTENKTFKVRFAPPMEGTWQYQLVATDASGTASSSINTFIAASPDPNHPSRHGFVKVAPGDRRYFELEDGTYFPALGYNMNYDHLQWVNPEADLPDIQNNNPENLKTMGQNGIQFVRIWLSQWSIFGSHWNPWREINSNGYDPPWTWLSYAPGDNPPTEFALYVGAPSNPCLVYGLNTPHPAVKPSTTYRIRVSFMAGGIPEQAGAGLVVKLTGDTENCNESTVGTKIIQPQTINTSDWQIAEGTYSTGSDEYFLSFLTLAVENAPEGWAQVRYVWIEEDLGGGQYGPNVLYKPFMDHHRYFDQRQSFGFDRVVDLAADNGVYLKPVVLDHREEILSSFGWDGLFVGQDLSPSYLYGPTDYTMIRSRWLETQWYRYLQARWGYSTAIHSWEFVNEGTPGSEHAVAVDYMGNYFDQFTQNQHLVSASTWAQDNSTAGFWGLGNYPGIDYADIHHYIFVTDPEQFFDAAYGHLYASSTWGASSNAIQGNWPIVRGETGFVEGDFSNPTRQLEADRNGVWLHNYLWSTIDSDALIEMYWYENVHIVCTWAYWCSSPFDHRPIYRPLYDFLSNIPLNQGGYVDIGATSSDLNVRAVGQKNIARGLAHLWVQNKRHSWCAVVGNVSGCTQPNWNNSRLSGTVTIPGLASDTTLTVEWWQFDNGGQLVKSTTTVTTNASGEILLDLNSLPGTVVDVGVKIGDYP